MAKLVSKVYGEALFEVAVDHGNAIRLMNETAELQKILEDNPDFDKLMKHPGIPKQEKLSMVEKVFRGRVSDDLTEFLKIVVTKERYGSLKAIFAYFTELVRESEKMGTAYVSTAVELTKEQKQAVREKLLATTSYQSFDVYYRVDPTLIGGMVIRVGDRVVDSSTSGTAFGRTETARRNCAGARHGTRSVAFRRTYLRARPRNGGRSA